MRHIINTPSHRLLVDSDDMFNDYIVCSLLYYQRIEKIILKRVSFSTF